MLVLYGTYRAHDERMKSVVSAERASWYVGARFMSLLEAPTFVG